MKRSDRKRALRAANATAAVTFRFDVGLLAQADDSAIPQPKWNQLFPMGTFHNGGWPKEGVTVDPAFCEAIVANWRKRGQPELAVDYFHKTNEEDAPNEERVASGWMQKLEARGDGLYALIKWTTRAREKILADELRYLSPEFHPNGVDARTGKPQGPTLVCAGLLTNPAFKEMPRVAAAEVVDPPAPPQPVAPKDTFIMNKDQIIALLAKAGITLAATCTDAEAAAALSKHVGDTAELKAKAETEAKALKAKADDEAAVALKAKAEAEATTKSLKAELDTKATEILKLDARLAQVEKLNTDAGINTLLARAKAEGRITAAGAEKNVRAYAEKMGLEAAAEFVDSFPKGTVAPVGVVIGHGGEGAGGQPVDVKSLQAKYDAEIDAVLAADKQGVQAASKKVNAKAEYAPLFAKSVINAGSLN